MFFLDIANMSTNLLRVPRSSVEIQNRSDGASGMADRSLQRNPVVSNDLWPLGERAISLVQKGAAMGNQQLWRY